MIVVGDTASAAGTRFSRVAPGGAHIWRTTYFGPPPSPPCSGSVDPAAKSTAEYVPPAAGEIRPPQAFLVEQEPGAVVAPHFHFVDQFQVVVDGDGSIGAHPVGPIMAHFAGAFTGYGPITPGTEGLKYFTFRASADGTGAQFLPGARAKMQRVPKRYVLAEAIYPSTPEALRRRTEPAVETVMSEPDGLAIHMLRIPPGGSVTAPTPGGAGQSIMVATGSIRADGAVLDRWGAMFRSPNEPALAAEAGAEGGEVLILQYPSTR
jgi:hypothetical protein